jgi:hypothetical protein
MRKVVLNAVTINLADHWRAFGTDQRKFKIVDEMNQFPTVAISSDFCR